MRHIQGEMNAPEVSVEFWSQLNTAIHKYIRAIIRNRINVILNAYVPLYLQSSFMKGAEKSLSRQY